MLTIHSVKASLYDGLKDGSIWNGRQWEFPRSCQYYKSNSQQQFSDCFRRNITIDTITGSPRLED